MSPPKPGLVPVGLMVPHIFITPAVASADW
jgi:hypothetical protein